MNISELTKSDIKPGLVFTIPQTFEVVRQLADGEVWNGASVSNRRGDKYVCRPAQGGTETLICFDGIPGA